MILTAVAKFIIIPCCFFELDGTKFTKNITSLGRYKTYIEHIESQCTTLGFATQRESLRIPSTKNVCIISQFPPQFDSCKVVESMIAGIEVKLRRSDRFFLS